MFHLPFILQSCRNNKKAVKEPKFKLKQTMAFPFVSLTLMELAICSGKKEELFVEKVLLFSPHKC